MKQSNEKSTTGTDTTSDEQMVEAMWRCARADEPRRTALAGVLPHSVDEHELLWFGYRLHADLWRRLNEESPRVCEHGLWLDATAAMHKWLAQVERCKLIESEAAQ